MIKHKGIKKGAKVSIGDFQQQLVDLTSDGGNPQQKLFEQYKLVKSNDNDWYLSRQMRKFGFLSDKRFTVGTARLNQLHLGHHLAVRVRKLNKSTNDLSEMCTDSHLKKLEEAEINFNCEDRNVYLTNGASYNWRYQIQKVIETDIFLDEAFHFKNTKPQFTTATATATTSSSSASKSSPALLATA